MLFHRAPADLLHLGLVAAQSAVLRCLVPPQRVSGDGERPEPHRTVPLSDTFQILITASSEPVASQWPLALHAAASTCGDARPREAGAAAAGMAAAPPHLPRVPPSLLAPSMPQPIADFDDLSRSSGRRGIHWRERVPACRHADEAHMQRREEHEGSATVSDKVGCEERGPCAWQWAAASRSLLLLLLRGISSYCSVPTAGAGPLRKW